MAGTQQDIDSDFKTYSGATNKVSSLADLSGTAGKIEDLIVTFVEALKGITPIDGWLAASGTMPLTKIKKSITVSSTNYTVADTDGTCYISVTTGASDRTITLPTAADNVGVEIMIIKADSGAGHVIIDGEGTEAIFNQNKSFLTIEIWLELAYVILRCDGSNWVKLNSPYLHMLDESSRNSSPDLTVNPTTTWTEADLSASVPPGTLALFGDLYIDDSAGASAKIYFRDGTSSETNDNRTAFSEVVAGGATAIAVRQPVIIKAKNGIFDHKEDASETVTNLNYVIWGWLL